MTTEWLAPHLKGNLRPLFHDSNVAVFHGDMRKILPRLTGIHNCISDPPYGIGILGKSWDKAVPGPDFWQPLLEALRPGAHLLSFWGSRTYHRGTVAIEDGGFEIRDMVEWVYATGFPKSMDVSKAIDAAAGARRKVVTKKTSHRAPGGWADMRNSGLFRAGATEFTVTAPATANAKDWQGWGTALKPAHEPITVARKPLCGTVAANVQEHGTGALHIDACRIGGGTVRVMNGHKGIIKGQHLAGLGPKAMRETTEGRWPANLIHDGSEAVQREMGQGTQFFFVAKPAPKERAGNDHPTIKPVALMRHLVRMTCRPGSVLVDPFGGSGTTGVAAIAEGVRCILIEQDLHNCRTIIKRLQMAATACAALASN